MNILKTFCFYMLCLYLVIEFIVWGEVNLNISEWDNGERFILAGISIIALLVASINNDRYL